MQRSVFFLLSHRIYASDHHTNGDYLMLKRIFHYDIYIYFKKKLACNEMGEEDSISTGRETER